MALETARPDRATAGTSRPDLKGADLRLASAFSQASTHFVEDVDKYLPWDDE